MAEPQVSELIIKGIVVGVFAENCWVIGNRRTGEAICIDPGESAGRIGSAGGCAARFQHRPGKRSSGVGSDVCGGETRPADSVQA